VIRKSLAAAVIAGATVLATPAVAEARPVPEQTPYCGPAFHPFEQYGACVPLKQGVMESPDWLAALGAAGVGVLGLLGLAIL
jgi:hypothetical protein